MGGEDAREGSYQDSKWQMWCTPIHIPVLECRLWLHSLSGKGLRRSIHMIRDSWAARICSQLHGCRIHVAEVCNLDVPCTSPSSPGLSPVQRLPEHVAAFWQIYLVFLLQIHKDY